LQDMRYSYEDILNKASREAKSEIRFDLRSLKEKGIDREPQPKMGPKVNYAEKRGIETDWGKTVRYVQHCNQAKMAQRSHHTFNQFSYLATRAVDHVRDDLAHKYYEVMYGAEHAYGKDQEHNQSWYER